MTRASYQFAIRDTGLMKMRNDNVHRIVNVLVLTFIAFTSGCNPSYVEPTAGESAVVTVRNTTNYRLILTYYADEQNCTNARLMADMAPMSERAVRFDVKRRATFGAQLSTMYLGGKEDAAYTVETCVLIASFAPVSGRSYEATVSLKKDRCLLELSRRDAAGKLVPELSFVPRKYQESLAITAGACAPFAAAENDGRKPGEFADEYRLPEKLGPLYEIVANNRVVGWLYGSLHMGSAERPSISRQAIYALAQTRHIYREYTDDDGSSIDMRGYVVDPVSKRALDALKQDASVTKVWNGLIDMEKRFSERGQYLGTTGLLISDDSYRANMTLAFAYCGAYSAYGAEETVLAFAEGRDITVHALETAESRKRDLDRTRDSCVKRSKPSKRLNLAARVNEETMRRELNEKICKTFDQQRWQSEDPAIYEFSDVDICINDNRNETMAARIVRAIEDGEKPFVIVGKLHLKVGRNLVQLLRKQGYEVN